MKLRQLVDLLKDFDQDMDVRVLNNEYDLLDLDYISCRFSFDPTTGALKKEVILE